MKRGTPRHPKTMLLVAELQIPTYAAVGILESLWHWTAEYAKRGDVGRYPHRGQLDRSNATCAGRTSAKARAPG